MLWNKFNTNNAIVTFKLDEINKLKGYIEQSYKKLKDKYNRRIWYVSKKDVSRKIITIYGEVNFKRTLFKKFNYKTNKYDYCFPVDEALNLKKYRQYDDEYIENVVKQFKNGCFNLRILANLFNRKSNKTSISNIINGYFEQKTAKKYKNFIKQKLAFVH